MKDLILSIFTVQCFVQLLNRSKNDEHLHTQEASRLSNMLAPRWGHPNNAILVLELGKTDQQKEQYSITSYSSL